ncbi:MAG: hypothetical protein ACP5JG_01095 [Anaerolineae bacterium]
MEEQKTKPVVKAGIWLGIGAVVTLCLVAVALLAGWLLWNRVTRSVTMFDGPGMMGRGTFQDGCEDTGWTRGMRRRAPESGGSLCAPDSSGQAVPPQGSWTVEEASAAFERYLSAQGYQDLVLSEVMEFEYNFYAITEEADTEIGAMELLLDKASGAVSPEMGPNMMWNAKYGMHRGGVGMMRSWADDLDNDVSEQEAAEVAQAWLDANRPGAQVEEHADPFYGYYTIHTVRDGEIEGMLSVHGDTAEVWYHTWHGEFLQMVEYEEHADAH